MARSSSKPRRETELAAFTRQNLDGEAIFANIQQLLGWLLVGHRPIYPRPDQTPGSRTTTILPGQLPPPIAWEPLNKDHIASLSLVINTQLKLLQKVLPDLKSVELHDSTSATPMSVFELAQRVRAVGDAARLN